MMQPTPHPIGSEPAKIADDTFLVRTAFADQLPPTPAQPGESPTVSTAPGSA